MTRRWKPGLLLLWGGRVILKLRAAFSSAGVAALLPEAIPARSAVTDGAVHQGLPHLWSLGAGGSSWLSCWPFATKCCSLLCSLLAATLRGTSRSGFSGGSVAVEPGNNLVFPFFQKASLIVVACLMLACFCCVLVLLYLWLILRNTFVLTDLLPFIGSSC